ncbi:MAG: DM13 domain-containing protein [Dehalococcoidia bacterium]
MELIGMLETVLAQLYPLRWLALVFALAVAGAAMFAAVRFGLVRAMLRRIEVTLALGIPVLALLVGAGWWLASPLFTRASLNEPAPVAAAPAAQGGGQGGALSAARPTGGAGAPTAAQPASKAAEVKTLRSGSFQGADEFHFGRGKASLIEGEGGKLSLRFEQFSVRNGPDLRVYLSPKANGWDRAALELGKLKATDGSFTYEIPAGTDLSQYKSVVIWCKPFSVLFATAPLQ